MNLSCRCGRCKSVHVIVVGLITILEKYLNYHHNVNFLALTQKTVVAQGHSRVTR